jgi:hypothetical protein
MSNGGSVKSARRPVFEPTAAKQAIDVDAAGYQSILLIE